MEKDIHPTYAVEPGAKIGRWTAIVEAPKRGHARYWLCQCECGTEREVYESGLRTGQSLSCGCLKADCARENAVNKTEIREGTTWGKWTVLSDFPSRRYYRMCRCECGTEREVTLSALLAGRSMSCGCTQNKKKRTSRRRFSQHKMTNTPTWISWIAAVQRCTDTNSPAYHTYGGAGVTICERWLTFENFFEDMGERPLGMTLDRIDNSKGYEPGNCRWATRQQQAENRSIARMITCNGETLNLSAWVRRTGIPRSAIYARLSIGWSIEEALEFKARPPRWEQHAAKGFGVTYDGRTMPLAAWCRERGLRENTVTMRLRRGWPLAEALGFEKRPGGIRARNALKKIQSGDVQLAGDI